MDGQILSCHNMWYKKSSYFDIGHKPSKGNPVTLWWWDGRLWTEDTEYPGYGHSEVVSRSLYNDNLCRGRYDPSINMVSIMALGGIPDGVVDAIKLKWPTAKIKVFRK